MHRLKFSNGGFCLGFALFLLVSLFMLQVQAAASPVRSERSPSPDVSASYKGPRVVVSGRSVIELKNDTMTLEIGLVNQGITAQTAVEANKDLTQKMTELLHKLGIETYSTIGYQLYPKYNQGKDGANVPAGYGVTNSVQLSLKGTDEAFGKVIDELAHLPVEVNNISFSSSLKTDQESMKVRALAFQDAKRKALAYAQAAHLSLGELVCMVDMTADMEPQPFYRNFSREMAVNSPSVFSSTTKIRGSVRATFLLKPRETSLQKP